MEEHFNKKSSREEFKQRIYKYIVRLLKFLKRLPKDDVSREIIKQLVRSGTSIGANYFEAQGASSKREYQNYFGHSLKSANESKLWLNVLLDCNFVPEESRGESIELLNEMRELANIFAASILTMKGKR